MKLLKSGLIASLALGVSLSLVSPAKAEQKYIGEPSVKGYMVGWCVNSYKYSDNCSKNAVKEAANKFCQHKGYDRAVNGSWKVWDSGWNRRRNAYVWHDMYRDGYHYNGYHKEVTSLFLDSVVCD